MGLKESLQGLIRTVLDEADRNPEFRLRLERALGDRPKLAVGQAPSRGTPARERDQPRKGGRRTPALIDPVEVVRNGEAALRERLAALDLEQLRDVVAQFGMDPGKLVMKWKDRSRVIERIVEVSFGRATKGDAFRAE